MRNICCFESKNGNTNGKLGDWSKQEDEKLIHYIKLHGDQGCWTTLPKAAGLQRCGKSCRLRWMKYLRPQMKRPNFCGDEEELIIKLHALLGDRWSLIAGRLPGRTESQVKEYWDSHIKRKLKSVGIDPNNHRVNQTLLFTTTTTCTTCKINNIHNNLNNICNHDPTKSTHPSTNDPKHLSNSPMIAKINKNSSIGDGDDDDEAVNSTHDDLNLGLTIAFPSPSRFTVVEKKQDVSDDELRVDIFDQADQNDEEKPAALVLFR